MHENGETIDPTDMQIPSPHCMSWRRSLSESCGTLLPEDIISYTNENQSLWPSVSFHLLCLYGTWTIWRSFHPRGEYKLVYAAHHSSRPWPCTGHAGGSWSISEWSVNSCTGHIQNGIATSFHRTHTIKVNTHGELPDFLWEICSRTP